MCTVADCLNPASGRTEYCWAHQKRRETGRSLGVPVRKRSTPIDYLFEAAIAYADAPVEDDKAFARARENLKRAARKYGGFAGPPRGEG